jgi:hypothetical protein
MSEDLKISQIQHPEYEDNITAWERFRSVYEADDDFINTYLETFSRRETSADFNTRKSISYVPAHSKAALIEVRNAIHQRLVDVSRKNGPKSFLEAAQGLDGGVDKKGNTMNAFMGNTVLTELLMQGKVGVFIDKNPILGDLTLDLTQNIRPYLYYYTVEDIKSWDFDANNRLTNVLLREYDYTRCEETGLPCDQYERYRWMTLTDSETVAVVIYDDSDNILVETELNLPEIPFVICELSQSLLNEVAKHQISLLNLASSDMSYATKSNYPFYTEQFNPQASDLFTQPVAVNTDTGKKEAEQAGKVADDQSVVTGSTVGRRYAKGLERPAFIHPSSEPLRASMEKQDQIKMEIRQLINLALTAIEPRRASAERLVMDQRPKEEGLSNIGIALEACERQVSKIWSLYEGSSVSEISYPQSYTLKSEEERRREGKELTEFGQQIASPTFQKEMAKRVVAVTVGHRLSNEILEKIEAEIDDAATPFTDPSTIREDHEAGFVSTVTASQLRGYPKEEVPKAAKDHEERLKRIQISQAPKLGAAAELGAKRGVPDQSVTPKEEAKEDQKGR